MKYVGQYNTELYSLIEICHMVGEEIVTTLISHRTVTHMIIQPSILFLHHFGVTGNLKSMIMHQEEDMIIVYNLIRFLGTSTICLAYS